jgi:hypothetical protein
MARLNTKGATSRYGTLDTFGDIMTEIPVEEFDKIEVAWCKYRNI